MIGEIAVIIGKKTVGAAGQSAGIRAKTVVTGRKTVGTARQRVVIEGKTTVTAWQSVVVEEKYSD